MGLFLLGYVGFAIVFYAAMIATAPEIARPVILRLEVNEGYQKAA